MILHKLDAHVKGLCKQNLASPRVRCCANCPFEDEITFHYPELKTLFQKKREECDDS